jgi:FtsH-binding integral membrane protein
VDTPADVRHNDAKSFNVSNSDDGGVLDVFSKLKGDDERQGFIIKVFSIMSIQVIFTALYTWWIISNEGRKEFCTNNLWLYFVCIAATVAIMCTLMCFKSMARTVPTNYILLFGFTVFESYIVGTIASLYDANSVILAAIYTVALFSILTLFACCTKGDIGCMGPIIVVSMCLGFLTFILYFVFPSELMHLIFCWVGLIITCIYVIYDVYLITEKHGLEYDDYIIGALLIYTDVITMFIYILSIIGNRN